MTIQTNIQIFQINCVKKDYVISRLQQFLSQNSTNQAPKKWKCVYRNPTDLIFMTQHQQGIILYWLVLQFDWLH